MELSEVPPAGHAGVGGHLEAEELDVVELEVLLVDEVQHDWLLAWILYHKAVNSHENGRSERTGRPKPLRWQGGGGGAGTC